MRFYRFDKASGGEWPADAHFQPGAIIRVNRSNSPRPGAVFNHDTCEWVSPVWVECADPRLPDDGEGRECSEIAPVGGSEADVERWREQGKRSRERFDFT